MGDLSALLAGDTGGDDDISAQLAGQLGGDDGLSAQLAQDDLSSQLAGQLGGDDGLSAQLAQADDISAQLAGQLGGDDGLSAQLAQDDLSSQLAGQLGGGDPPTAAPVQKSKDLCERLAALDDGKTTRGPQWNLTVNVWRTRCGQAKQPLSLTHRTAVAVHPTRHRLFRHGVFFKSAKWSPDGSVLLASSEDNVLRLFELPESLRESGASTLRAEDVDASEPCRDLWPTEQSASPYNPVLSFTEGECVYDYAWFPMMHESQHCCFITSTRDHPLHLWDAASGALRASYRAYGSQDEIVSAHSVAFSRDGTKIVGGYKNILRIFDAEREGRYYTDFPTRRKTKEKKRGKKEGMSGIVSSLAFFPQSSQVLAAGTFSGQMRLYDLRSAGKELLSVPRAHAGGLTHMVFAPSGDQLFTGARKDPHVHSWDIRLPSRPVGTVVTEPTTSMERDAATNQRITFDIDPAAKFLYTGCRTGCLRVYSLRDGHSVTTMPLTGGSPSAPAEALNGVQRHPTLPLFAVTTGERRFKVPSCARKEPPKRRRVDSSESSGEADEDPTPTRPIEWEAADALSANAGSLFAEEHELCVDGAPHPPCPSHIELWLGGFLYFQ